MDYRSLPVAKRTRRGQELYWKGLYEKNRKKNPAGESSQTARDAEEKNGRRRKSTHESKKLSRGSSVEYVSVDDSDDSEEEARAYELTDVSDEAEANAGPPPGSQHNKSLGKRKSSNWPKKWMSGCSMDSESIEISIDDEEATAGPSTGAKKCKKVLGRRKSGNWSKKWMSGCSMDSESIEVSNDDEATTGPSTGAKKCKKVHGKRKSGSRSKKWRSRCSMDFESIDDSDDGEEATAGPSRGAKREKKFGKRKSCEGSKKWRSRCSLDFESIDDSNDSEEATAAPSRGAKREKKVGKQKPCEGSMKRRSGCSMDYESIDVSGGEVPSVEINGEDSCGENGNDRMDFDEIQSAGSKNGKTSEFGYEKTEKSGPFDLEDSDSDVVYIGEEGGGGGGRRGFASDSSYETETLLSSEEESAHSDDEDYDPEESESSEFFEELSSSDGDSDDSDVEVKIQRTDKSDIRVKKLENVNEGEKRKRSRKARKRESVEDNVEVMKVHNIDEREVKKGLRKEEKGRSVEGCAEVKKRQHVGDSQQSNESDVVVKMGQSTGKSDVEVKKMENVNEREKKKGRRKAIKRESVEDNVEVKKLHVINERAIKKGLRKEGKGKIVEGGAEVKKGQHVGNAEQEECFEDDNVDDTEEKRRNSESVNEPLPVDVEQNDVYEKRTGLDDKKSDEHDKIFSGNLETACDRGKAVFDKQNDVEKKKTGSLDRRNDEEDDTFGGIPISEHKNKGHMEKLTNRQSMWETKDCNVFKILVDSIYGKGEVLREESDTFRNEASEDEGNPLVAEDTTLPLKFTFGSTSTQSSVPKKKEMDPEEKELWDDLGFALRSCEIGSTESHEVDNQDSLPTVCEENAATLCKRGIHQLILDEEIGLRCKYCTYLDQEIKYIVPEFVKYPFERVGTRGSEPDNLSIFDELRSHNSGSDPQTGCSSPVHAEGRVWDFIPGVESSMYPHQREGFEFIWNHIAGGIHVEELKRRSSDYSGNGCIISHAPGTGKTRLTIVFLQTYLELFPKCRPLLIAPRSMLLTWEEEFKKWEFDIPFHNLNNTELSGEENETAVELMMQIDGRKSINRVNNSRLLKLYSWAKKRSILGISYHLFEKLSGADHSGAQKTGLAEELRKILLEFPGLVVFDEGHTPRNDQSHIWKALSEIKTKRRILLSGTPFQNNFQELFNTICLVRPMFAASIDSAKFTGDFLKNRARKSNVEKWQWTSVANCSEKVADEKEKHATEVKAKIAPFVNVYKGSVLQDSLPGLRNSVVVLHPMHLQKKFHQRIQGVKEQFQYEHLEAINSIHPSLLLHEDAFSGDWDRLKELKLNADAGVKTKFLLELIRLSDALNERVLVFCQYISPLILIRDLLRSQFHWTEGEEVLYMDGKCDMKQRQSSMKIFNDPFSKAKVLLASTKGCCEGISLVGASRVVLLDVTWNPSVERQAISRAYRLGQKKIVYVYHLLMDGTNEEHKYRRQVDKSRLSELVFSDSDRYDSLEKKIRAVSEDKILDEMAQHEKLKHIFESIALLHEDIYFEQLGLSTFG